MHTYNFFEDYNRLTAKLGGSQHFKGYVHEPNETDCILEALRSDPKLFSALFTVTLTAINNTKPHKPEERRGAPYINRMPGITTEPDKFLAGCAVVALVYSLSVSARSLRHGLPSGLLSRYVIVNMLARHMASLYKLVGLAANSDYRAFDCLRSLAFSIVTRLCYAGVLIPETRKLKSKTDVFVKINVVLPSVSINTLDIYKQPGHICLLDNRPYYVSLHFTHTASIITDNNGNVFKSSFNDVAALTKLSSTKVFFDHDLARKNIDSLKATYPELAKVNNSSEAMALLKVMLRDAQSGDERYSPEQCEVGSETLAGLEGQEEAWLTNQRKYNEVLGRAKSLGRGWADQADKEGVSSHVFNVYAVYVMLESPHLVKEGIYFKYAMDFRGRIYCRSIAGFTYNKLARYSILLEGYTSDERSSATLEP